MLYYLHTKEKRFTDSLAVRMFQCGEYALIPPPYASVWHQVVLASPFVTYSQGVLGDWYSISVASAI